MATQKSIVINANRDGYGTDQCWSTMTIRQMISTLENIAYYEGEDTLVYIGNDYQGDDDWYTYGGINEEDFYVHEEEVDDDEDEDEEDEEEDEDEEEA